MEENNFKIIINGGPLPSPLDVSPL